MTNIEKIRNMSADEMADRIDSESLEKIIADICRKECKTNTGSEYTCPYRAEDDTVVCRNCIKRWLESEAEE